MYNNDMSDTLSIAVTCRQCGDTHLLEPSREGFIRWKLEGELIQAAMPELNADQRELLISSICGKCFDAMFASE